MVYLISQMDIWHLINLVALFPRQFPLIPIIEGQATEKVMESICETAASLLPLKYRISRRNYLASLSEIAIESENFQTSIIKISCQCANKTKRTQIFFYLNYSTEYLCHYAILTCPIRTWPCNKWLGYI